MKVSIELFDSAGRLSDSEIVDTPAMIVAALHRIIDNNSSDIAPGDSIVISEVKYERS